MSQALTPEEMAIGMRLRRIRRERAKEQSTPSWWDSDCRCCLMVNTDRNLRQRQMKGVVPCLVIEGEEVHAWHTNEELLRFIDVYRERTRNAN